MKYRKRPIIVEAIQYTGQNGREVADFMGCQAPYITNNNLIIGTLEGIMTAIPSDWIIRGIKGEYYACKEDIFKDSYEIVDESLVSNVPHKSINTDPSYGHDCLKDEIKEPVIQSTTTNAKKDMIWNVLK